MDIHVLGGFGVFRDGRRLKINSSTVSGRYVAALATTGGLRASHAHMGRRLWPDVPPDGFGIRLRQTAAELRREAPGLLPERNDRGQCSLAVQREEVDYLRFRDRSRTARELRGTRKYEALRDALGEWHGDPLQDFSGAGFEDDRTRLLNELLAAWELYLQTGIDAGLAIDVLREIDIPLARFPGDPRLFAIKLHALKIASGPAEVRRAMEEWRSEGRTPDRSLSDRYKQLVGRGGPSDQCGPSRMPQQLSAHRRLVGRAEQCAELDRLLLDGSPSSRVAVLSGMPGAGKTAIALSWAESARTSFTDGVLQADLNGYAATEPTPPEEVLSQFLDDLDVEASTPTLAGMIAAYRTAIAKRNVLVLLDNARDAQQVRPLLPGPGRSSVLITSRDRMDSLIIREAAHSVPLGRLPRDEAVELLAELGGIDVQAAGDVPKVVAELCGHLPLSLVIVGAMIRTRALGDLWRAKTALSARSVRVSDLSVRGDDRLDVTSTFSMSHRVLSSEAKRLFWRLAVHPGPTISRVAVSVLDGRAGDELSIPALDELRAASLLEEPANERYAFHDLTREFAETKAQAEPDEERDRVAARAFDFLIHNAWSCDRVLVPGRSLPVGTPAGFTAVAPASVAEAMAWLATEYPTLKRAVGHAAERGMHRHTWLLAMTLVTYQWRANRYEDALKTLTSADEAAEQVATPGQRSMVHRMLAGTYRGQKKYQQAKWHARVALELAGSDDPQGIARSQNSLAILCRETGDLTEATRLFAEVLARFQDMGDVLGEAGALDGLGCIHLSLGDHEKALRHCDGAVRLFATTGDVNGHANALVNRGRSHLARGEPDRAAADLGTALTNYRKLSYPRNEARTLVEFADSLAALQRTGEAREMLLRAEELFNDLNAPTDEVTERIRRLG